MPGLNPMRNGSQLCGVCLAPRALLFFSPTSLGIVGNASSQSFGESWGGKPTTQLLRHSGPAKTRVSREQWHKQISKIYGKTLPTESEERENPEGADNEYDAATRLLIEKTRDAKAYPFVYRDNVNYGFCRNLYALRRVGIFASCFCIAGMLGSGIVGLEERKSRLLTLGILRSLWRTAALVGFHHNTGVGESSGNELCSAPFREHREQFATARKSKGEPPRMSRTDALRARWQILAVHEDPSEFVQLVGDLGIGEQWNRKPL